MSDLFIDDSHTFEETIPEVPGIYPSLFVVYRRAVNVGRLKYFKAMDRTPEEQDEITAKLFVEHVQDWDATLDGKKAPIVVDLVKRVPPGLRTKILDLILGYTPAKASADAKN